METLKIFINFSAKIVMKKRELGEVCENSKWGEGKG